MIKRIIFVEGKSDLKFILGLLGIRTLRKCDGIKYDCYYGESENTCICEGGGKDNVCERVNTIIQDKPDIKIEVHVLLDGDARGISCNGAIMHYLNHRNIDELIFEVVQGMLRDKQRDKLIMMLLESESGNEDSKKKAYLAMYVVWKYRDVLGLGGIDYWPNLHDFYHDLGILISKSGNVNEVLNSEGEIRSIINLLKKD
ncbi:hypothetical protein [Vulcanisaeta distributa]|uniref:DUF4435 domain-containing protein n=1 Tax=Vulcanisaeta distributa (strain DSM 14429 / JCM 11212 / NBRC 100878 / IC-017) TaxID=572478 RepID=E1QSU9_VULDI|nr:hypothetical protein [Vulcanisaeta distributa]ADN50816.1 hypothetical protein Vdis_1430 [Vulcanisaeta distributa DSM 14429]